VDKVLMFIGGATVIVLALIAAMVVLVYIASKHELRKQARLHAALKKRGYGTDWAARNAIKQVSEQRQLGAWSFGGSRISSGCTPDAEPYLALDFPPNRVHGTDTEGAPTHGGIEITFIAPGNTGGDNPDQAAITLTNGSEQHLNHFAAAVISHVNQFLVEGGTPGATVKVTHFSAGKNSGYPAEPRSFITVTFSKFPADFLGDADADGKRIRVDNDECHYDERR
jgi:hypothetical protein